MRGGSKRRKGERTGVKKRDLRHEHRAPSTLFSVAAFSQLQFSADCFPQEHVALVWQMQVEAERPQQVVGTAILVERGVLKGGFGGGCERCLN